MRFPFATYRNVERNYDVVVLSEVISDRYVAVCVRGSARSRTFVSVWPEKRFERSFVPVGEPVAYRSCWELL